MIVLLTDFGQSEYVGVMKGVIYNIYGGAKVVDLCHNITAQNIIEASWVLKGNYKYFPKGAVFCCVVDPGVGTERKAIAVKTENYNFVAPNNGLLWETLREQKVLDIRQIPIPADAGRTFHGRDVFAKAAASIGQGRFEDIGPKMEEIEKLEFYLDGRAGIVVRIDGFGNVITNLAGQNKDQYTVLAGEKKWTMKFHPNYALAEEGEPFLIEGSNNTLEISLKNASADDKLHLMPGNRISIS